MTHPSNRLDEVVHQRTRLGILALLAPTRSADFVYLRDALGLTDGNLSRHLQVLEEAGYVTISKGYEGKKPRTWIAITAPGRKAVEKEVAALRELVAGLDGIGRAPSR